jgi:sporulation protein YlmC with PRC-barrel domain
MKKSKRITMMLFLVLSPVLLAGGAFAQRGPEWSAVNPDPRTFLGAPCTAAMGVAVPYTAYAYEPKTRSLSETSWLIGHRVTDSRGGSMGQISSLIIDNRNGRIALIVLSDVPNLGTKQMPVPYRSIVRTGENLFELKTGSMDGSVIYGIPSAISLAWVKDIYRHYGQALYWTEEGTQPPKDMDLYQNTRLMGAAVQTPQGEKVAKVNDLVNSQDGHIVRVVVSDIAGRGETLVAVPFSDLSRRDENTFVLNATREKLANEPRFNEQAELTDLKSAGDSCGCSGGLSYWTKGAMNGQEIFPPAAQPETVLPGEIFPVDHQLEQFEIYGY